jgi:hypothetical protein
MKTPFPFFPKLPVSVPFSHTPLKGGGDGKNGNQRETAGNSFLED